MAFLFCCLLGLAPGIVAIVQGSQVNGRLNAGDYAGAHRASQNARTWGWVALGLGLVGLVILAAMAATGNLSFYYGGDNN